MGVWSHLRQKPDKEALLNAASKTTEEIIAPNLKVLFCGINPGLYSAATGHNFANPNNRFWRVLHRAGFTPHKFHPSEERDLLKLGYGLTNFTGRTTASAAGLEPEELIEGGKRLVEKVEKYKPENLAVLGIGAYRTAFGRPKAKLSLQPEMIGKTRIWVLPSPSGLNGHYKTDDLIELFRELREFV
jgi:TDG/mug DNA glycosylase family protein